MTRTLSTVTLFLGLASCAPFPHREHLAGQVRGVLTDESGKSVAGAKVTYVYRGFKKLGTTETDPEGKYALGPYYQWFYLVYPGVVPFPLSYGAPGVPDSLVTEKDGQRSVPLRGDAIHYSDKTTKKTSFRAPAGSRWSRDGGAIELRTSDQVSGLPDSEHQLQGITMGSLLGLAKPPRM